MNKSNQENGRFELRRGGHVNFGLVFVAVLSLGSVTALTRAVSVASEEVDSSGAAVSRSLEDLGDSCSELLGLVMDPQAFEEAVTGFSSPIRHRR